MTIKSEIDTIIHETGGASITAPLLVERARDAERFPKLNKHLWQMPEADLAAEARLMRAHRLLITIHVTVPEGGERTRMLVHTVGTPGYQTLASVVAAPDLAMAKIRQLTEDIGRARARLRAFRAAIPEAIAEDIDEALAEAEARAVAALTPVEAAA